MQIRTFHAPTLEQAQAAVRSELGPEALILGTEEAPGGVSITAAIEPEDDLAGLLAPERAAPDPQLAALMAYHGVPASLRAELARAAAGAPLEQGLAQALKSCVSAAPIGRRHVLLGLPGHGKTLTAARLARGMADAGARPTVVALEDADAPPDGRLAHWLRDGGVTLETVRDLDGLQRAAARPGPLVVDTPGLSPMSARGAARLRALARGLDDVVPTLVVSVEGAGQSLLETAVDFLTLGCRNVLPTKLDLTARYGGLVTLAAGGVTVLPASVSGRVGDALAPLHPSGLARLLVHRFKSHVPSRQAQGEARSA